MKDKQKQIVTPFFNRFLRVRGNSKTAQIQPKQILQALQNNQLLYLDFADERPLKILQKDNVNDSDQQIQTIGNNHIGGLNNLSPNSYRMVQFLSQNKKVDQNKKNIDDFVKSRMKKMLNKTKYKSKERKKIKNYSLDGKKYDSPKKYDEIDDSDSPSKIEQYLQRAHNRVILQKLKQREKQLQRSLSSVHQFVKLNLHGNSQDLKIKKQATQFKLPQLRQFKQFKCRYKIK